MPKQKGKINQDPFSLRSPKCDCICKSFLLAFLFVCQNLVQYKLRNRLHLKDLSVPRETSHVSPFLKCVCATPAAIIPTVFALEERQC